MTSKDLTATPQHKERPKPWVIKPRDKSKVVICLIGLTLAILVLGGALLLALALILRADNRVYVVLENKKMALAAPRYYSYEREDEAIAKTTVTWAKMFWQWTLKGENQGNVKSFSVENKTASTDGNCLVSLELIFGEKYQDKYVPCQTYDASALILHPQLKRQFLSQVAAEINPEIKESPLIREIKIFFISQPQQIETGKYQIEILFIETEKQGERAVKEDKYQLRLTFLAAPPDEFVLDSEQALVYRRKMHELFSSGLMIIGLDKSKITPQ